MNWVDFLLNRQQDPKLAEEIRLAQEKAKRRKEEKKSLADNTIKDSEGIRWQMRVNSPTELQRTKEKEKPQDSNWMQGWEIKNDK